MENLLSLSVYPQILLRNHIRELRAAGGAPLKVGLAAGAFKYVLALVVVLLFVAKEANF